MHILWITCDEMRWDALPSSGNPVTTMPASDRLAREGTRFSQTFCQMPKCVPSRCSMLTGRYPHVDGFRTLRGLRNAPDCSAVLNNDMVALHEDTPNIVPLLRKAGYRTCLLGKNHIVEWNLHQKWFDKTPSWNFDRIPKNEKRAELRRASFGGTIPLEFDLSRHHDAVTADEAIEFITSDDERPFFALVDMSLPHPCYFEMPGTPVISRPLADIPPGKSADLENAPATERAIRLSKDLESLPEEDRLRLRRAYWSMCEFADQQVNRILDALDASGKAADTLVIYTADHGDFAGDHNCYEKWDTVFYDCITRVPLLIRLPGKAKAGHHSPALVELIDLFPTILEAVELPCPFYAQGRSLLPLLRGETPAWRDTVICQGGVEKELTTRIVGCDEEGTDPVKQKVLCDFPETMERARMIRSDTEKYVHRLNGNHEYFDLVADPHELNNAIGDPSKKERINHLREKLLERLMEAESKLPEVASLYA
jgi:arylsulfatase A-like enzyme